MCRREQSSLDDGIALATMDIFAGCGGLSEGLHQAGAAYSRSAHQAPLPVCLKRLTAPEGLRDNLCSGH